MSTWRCPDCSLINAETWAYCPACSEPRPIEKTENLTTGYIRLYRSVQDNPIWQHPDYLRIWLYLLLNASWKDRLLLDGTPVQRGSLLTGRMKLARETATGEQVIRNCLAKLEATRMITTQPTKQGTLISIINYNIYQSGDGMEEPGEQPAEEPTGSKDQLKPLNQQPTDNQPTTTSQPTNETTNAQNRINTVDTISSGGLLDDAQPTTQPTNQPSIITDFPQQTTTSKETINKKQEERECVGVCGFVTRALPISPNLPPPEDLESRLIKIAEDAPNQQDYQKGVDLAAQTVISASDPIRALETMERTIPGWWLAMLEGRARSKCLRYVIQDGDWMRDPPAPKRSIMDDL
jgi:hypothetical protein